MSESWPRPTDLDPNNCCFRDIEKAGDARGNRQLFETSKFISEFALATLLSVYLLFFIST